MTTAWRGPRMQTQRRWLHSRRRLLLRVMGALLRWLVICILTLGVGLLFYSFYAARAALDHTSVEWY